MCLNWHECANLTANSDGTHSAVASTSKWKVTSRRFPFCRRMRQHISTSLSCMPPWISCKMWCGQLRACKEIFRLLSECFLGALTSWLTILCLSHKVITVFISMCGIARAALKWRLRASSSWLIDLHPSAWKSAQSDFTACVMPRCMLAWSEWEKCLAVFLAKERQVL
jgi:hypothetical protein